MLGDIVSAVITMDSPEVVGLKFGVAVVNDLLRHRRTEADTPVAPLSSIPGRLRLRVAAIKGAPGIAKRMEHLFFNPASRPDDALCNKGV